MTAVDKNKDQSYFLWTLTPEQVSRSLFPIGDYLKPEVRKIAKKAGLITAKKKDSQGICFLGQVSLKDFLKKYIPEKKGAVLDSRGRKIGEHSGAWFYTIGQRHLGMSMRQESGAKGQDRKPFYVAEKNIKNNTITVAEGDDDPKLYKKEVALHNVNLNFIPSPNSSRLVYARVRYRQPLAKASIKRKGSGIMIKFAKPIKFVAPGQSAVFYSRAGRMLGGGVIA